MTRLPSIITLWRILREFYKYGTGTLSCKCYFLCGGELSFEVEDLRVSVMDDFFMSKVKLVNSLIL